MGLAAPRLGTLKGVFNPNHSLDCWGLEAPLLETSKTLLGVRNIPVLGAKHPLKAILGLAAPLLEALRLLITI